MEKVNALMPDMQAASREIADLPEGVIWVLPKAAYFPGGADPVNRALKDSRSSHFYHLHHRQNLREVARRAREEHWKDVDPDTLDNLLRDGKGFRKFVDEGKVWVYGLHKTAVQSETGAKARVGYEWMIGPHKVRLTYDRIFAGLQLLQHQEKEKQA